MRRTTTRLTVALLVLALAGGCASGSLEDVQKQVEGKSTKKSSAALEVKPPPVQSTRLNGRIGIVLATNSPTFGKLVGSPKDKGVSVLFVQPKGPADGKGIEVGDVITAVDDEPTPNAERAITVLLSKVGQRRNLDVSRKDGSQRSVTVQAQDPRDINVADLYGPLIVQRPEDAVLRFLRAQVAGKFDEMLADINRAVDLQPAFVEAIAYRAELVWNTAAHKTGITAEQLESDRQKAIDDWNLALRLDDANTRVLSGLANALALRGNLASAKRLATKASKLDEEYAAAYYSLAISELMLGRYDQAAAPARKAVDLNPYDLRYYRTLAIVFMRLDRKEDARRTVDAILPLVDEPAEKENLQSVLKSGVSTP